MCIRDSYKGDADFYAINIASPGTRTITVTTTSVDTTPDPYPISISVYLPTAMFVKSASSTTGTATLTNQFSKGIYYIPVSYTHLILAHAQTLFQIVKERSPYVPIEYREKLTARIAELMDHAPVEEQRIAAETAIFADKCSIDEEITRFESHIQQFYDTLEAGGAVGRRLDFLVQEMNREVNTVSYTHLVKELFQSSELESEHVKNLLKIIGAAYIVDFSASLCRDMGEASMASKIELAGRIFIVLLAVPWAQTLIGAVKSLGG